MNRNQILAAPHLAHVADHPGLTSLTDDALSVFSQFMLFCQFSELGEPKAEDLMVFATMDDVTPAGIRLLGMTLFELGAGDQFRSIGYSVADRLSYKQRFAGNLGRGFRTYRRSVSVPVEDLPGDWQETIDHIEGNAMFAKSVIVRMKQRLGMFAWSAERAGLTVNLGCPIALKALFDDIQTRSAEKNDGTPRYAYLRSTWEELYRFATCNGEPQETLTCLQSTRDVLDRMERTQAAQKITKLLSIGTPQVLLDQAHDLLEASSKIKNANQRHAARNTAAAIAIGLVVPARPGDVYEHHVFGKGIFFCEETRVFEFRYTPTKTARVTPKPLKIKLDPRMNKFLDALILGDHHTRYLEALRTKMMQERRPLYVNFDGRRCVKAWYSRAWTKVTGTGGHIARSLAYDAFAGTGEFGLRYGKAINHHKSRAIVEKYRSDFERSKAIDAGQNTLTKVHQAFKTVQPSA